MLEFFFIKKILCIRQKSICQFGQLLKVSRKVLVGVGCKPRFEIEQVDHFEGFLCKGDWNQVSTACKVDDAGIQINQFDCSIYKVASKRNQQYLSYYDSLS